MKYSSHEAAELSASWINGNRTYVLDEILKKARTKRDAAAFAIRVYDYLMSTGIREDDTYDAQSFIRAITDRALD